MAGLVFIFLIGSMQSAFLYQRCLGVGVQGRHSLRGLLISTLKTSIVFIKAISRSLYCDPFVS